MHIPRRTAIAAIATLALGVFGCEGDPTGPAETIHLPRSLSASEVAIIDASNRFAFDLLRQVAATEDGPNIFLSPLSASMALA